MQALRLANMLNFQFLILNLKAKAIIMIPVVSVWCG